MRLSLAVLAASIAVALSALAGVARAADTDPVDALQPLAFLAGHCWTGTFPGGKGSDEHCFAWAVGGRVLRDTHTVRAPGRPDATGESTYYVNGATHRVEFLYVESDGGFSRGTVESQPGALVFPDMRYTEGDETLTLRARWTPQGADAYEAAEAQTPQGWQTMFRLVMKRTR